MLTASARILLRRWVWAALVLVLALTAGAAVYKKVKPKQASTAEVLFLPSASQSGTAALSNPFLSLGDSTMTMSFVIQTGALDSTVVDKLAREGYTASYTIVPNAAPNSGPTLFVKTQDKSAAVAQATLNAVLDEMQALLRAKQVEIAGLPGKLYITASVLTKSPHPIPVRKSQIQTAVLALIAVLFGGIILILLVERIRMTRAKRRLIAVSPNGRSTNGDREAGQPASHGYGQALGPGLGQDRWPAGRQRIRRRRRVAHDSGPPPAPSRREPERDPTDEYSPMTMAASSSDRAD